MISQLISTIKRIGFVPFLCKLYNRTFIKDKNILSMCDRNGAYDYLMRKYPLPSFNCHSRSHKEKTIWTCWLQGEENAPQIVKVAINSMRKWAGDYNVVVITSENKGQYIQLPEWVEEKYVKGIIPAAHYSDLIRLTLLQQYGGVWLDSTIYVTGELPGYLTDSPIFCYKCDPMSHEIMGNSILAADKNDPIIVTTLQYLLKYWKNENKLVSYSLFHIAWDIVVHSSQKMKELWENIPYVTFRTQKILRQDLSNPYSQQRFEDICKMTSVHKFTYKFKEYHIDTQTKGTFYDVLVNREQC